MSLTIEPSPSSCHGIGIGKRSIQKPEEDIFHMVEFRPRSKTMSEMGKYRKQMGQRKVKRTFSDDTTRQNAQLQNEKRDFSFNVDTKSNKERSLIRPRSYTMSDLQRKRMEKAKLQKRSSLKGNDCGKKSASQSARIVKESLQNENQIDSTWDTMPNFMKNKNSDDIRQNQMTIGDEEPRLRSKSFSFKTVKILNEKDVDRQSFIFRHIRKYDVPFHIPNGSKTRQGNIQNQKGEALHQIPYVESNKSQGQIIENQGTPDIRVFDHEGNSKWSSIESSINCSGSDSDFSLPQMRKRANTVAASSMRRMPKFLQAYYPSARIEISPYESMEDSSSRSSELSSQYENDFQNPYRLRAFTIADQITLRKVREKISKRHNVSKQSYEGSKDLRQSPCLSSENLLVDEGIDRILTNVGEQSIGTEQDKKSSLDLSNESDDFDFPQSIDEQYVEIPDLESPSHTLIEGSEKSRNSIFHKKNVRYKVSNDMSKKFRRKRKSRTENRRGKCFSECFNSFGARIRRLFCASTEEEVEQLSGRSTVHRLRSDTPFPQDFDK